MRDRHESFEDYLEQILMLNNKLGCVRSIDIVNSMGYSKPSISIAMKKLSERNLIYIDEHGYIILTTEGYQIAKEVLEKHEILTDFLIALGVDEEIASKDACRLEHNLSKEAFGRIKEHYYKNIKPNLNK